jgi:hypothetical protein
MDNSCKVRSESCDIVEPDAVRTEDKLRILNEGYLGKRSLSEILTENNISEETFYLWKMSILK